MASFASARCTPAPPLLWLQNPQNKGDVLACARCGYACAGDQLRHLAKAREDGKSKPGVVQSARILSEDNRMTTCECELGCGITYCSPRCRALDADSGHAQLCVGPHDDNHPLYRYIVLALESGDAYAEFIMAARMSVLASLGSGHQSKSSSAAVSESSSPDNAVLIAQATAFWTNVIHDETIPYWWTLVSTELFTFEADQYKEAAEQLVKEAWELLQEAMGMKQGQTFHANFHYGHFGRILTFLSREKLNLSVTSSLESYITDMAATGENDWDSGDITVFTTLAQSIARHQLEQELKHSADVEGGADTPSLHRLRVFLAAEPVKAMRMIVAQPSLYLTPPLAVICIPSASSIGLPHSCVPTAKIQALFLKTQAIQSPTEKQGKKKVDGSGASDEPLSCRLALRMVSTHSKKVKGRLEPLRPTVSKIDHVEELELEERVETLALCGMTCTCDRCKYEKQEASDTGDKSALSVGALVSLALAAQDQERYVDARDLWDSVISFAPQGGDAFADALYNRARLSGWCDEWSTADRLFVDAQCLAPKHAGIAQWLRESRSYATLGTNTSESDDVAQKGTPPNVDVEGSLFGGRAFVRKGILTADECAQTIRDVEEHVAASQKGWTTSRHYAVPTTDIPIHAVPSVLNRFNRILIDRVFPLLAEQFKVKAHRIRVIDAFVVKYCAESQRSLPLHCDQSQFSLTITLNCGDEYDGGGTYFAEQGEIVNSRESGAVISFEGSLLHGGHPITRGTRYIIVAFLYAYKEEEE